ncbi:MAG: signal peptidase II [Candidatus Puniceispirillales bacterium WSBS_2018_MAG_OTU23]
MMMPHLVRHARRYFVVALVAAVDQAAKQVALNSIFTPPITVDVLPFLRFAPVWNDGISFGLLGGGGAIIAIALTCFAVAVAVILPFIARHWDRLSVIGALLMAGGALGNAIDRIIYGRVVDFIDVFAGQWHWPAFNIADISICVGAGCLLIAAMQDSRAGGD